MHYDEITGNMVGDDVEPAPSSYRPVYQPPAHDSSRKGGLWAEYNEFISDIGRWFEANGTIIPISLAFAVLAIVAILVVLGIIQTWRAGDPISAIIAAVICGFVAVRGYWIALGILYGFFWSIFFVGRFVFKNATRFTIIVLIAVGIHYLSTHQEAQEALRHGIQLLGRDDVWYHSGKYLEN